MFDMRSVIMLNTSINGYALYLLLVDGRMLVMIWKECGKLVEKKGKWTKNDDRQDMHSVEYKVNGEKQGQN